MSLGTSHRVNCSSKKGNLLGNPRQYLGCCSYSSCMADVIIYRSAVLLHRVRHLMVFVATPFGGKEAILTHIKVETLEAAVAETTDWRGLEVAS